MFIFPVLIVGHSSGRIKRRFHIQTAYVEANGSTVVKISKRLGIVWVQLKVYIESLQFVEDCAVQIAVNNATPRDCATTRHTYLEKEEKSWKQGRL